jgi:hypothetical protein
MEPSRETIIFALALVFFSQKGNKPKGRPLGPEWSDEDMLIFASSVKATGVPVEAALLVYTAESNLDPKASSGVAWGLAQITAGTLRDLKWSEPAPAFGKLSVADQVPWIVQLLEYQKKAIGFTPATALDLAVANLSPAAARAKRFVVYDSKKPGELAAYNGNAGLDSRGKGNIDRDDVAAYLRSWRDSETYKRALVQLARVQHGR